MRLRNLIGGIALSLFSMLATQTAFAGTCASPVDSDGQNVTINVTGDCNITTPINVPGTVNITVANGNLTMSQPVASNGPVNVTVSGGYISEQAVTSNQDLITLKADSITGTSLTAYGIQTTSTVGSTKFTGTLQTVAGNMLLVAQTSLATGNLVETIGYMDLKAYAGGTGVTPFVIGGSGNSNGINGTVKATGGSFGNDGIMVVNGVFTQTGVSSSVGDITIASASAFNLATPSGSGATFGINLNANSGTITLPAGEINMDASGGNGNAGYIALEAATISAPSGSILSSNQAASETVGRTIWIGASNINFGGSSGLTVRANGGYGSVNFYPTGGLNFSDSEDVSNLAWGIGPNNAAGSIAFNGSGSPLVIAANGNNGQVNINAYPLTFASSSLSITANGNASSFIGLGVGNNTKTGNAGITFNVTGATTIDASGSASQNGGNVTIWEDQVSINGTTFAIKANGPSSGNGNGGTLSLLWSNTILNSATKASFSANGASATTATGSGGSITYWPGAPTLAFGNGAGQMSILARGGKGGGNGGSISVSGNTMSFNGTQAGAMDVSVQGATGDGGTLSVNGGTITFSGTGYKLAANAGTTQGKGGNVSLSAFAALKVGNSAGGVQFSATGSGTGNGGTVNVGGLPLTMNGGSVNVSAGAGSGSNAQGGIIKITSNFGGTITGVLTADGVGNGVGGDIEISGDNPALSSATISAIGGTTGKGGTFKLTTTGTSLTTIDSNTVVNTNGGASLGDGGGITFNVAGPLTVNGVLQANSPFGSGGTISLTAAGALTTGANTLSVAAGNGTGGQLSLNGNTVTTNGNLSATGALGIGSVKIIAGSTATLNGSIDASATNGGIGGTVDVQANTIQFGSGSYTYAAKGSKAGGGGTVTFQQSGGPLSITNATFVADDGPTAPASTGVVQLYSVEALSLQSVTASAVGTNSGGQVIIQSGVQSLTLDSKTVVLGGPISLEGTDTITNNGSVSGVGTSSSITVKDSTGSKQSNVTVTGSGSYQAGTATLTTLGQITISGSQTFSLTGSSSASITAQLLVIPASTSLTFTAPAGSGHQASLTLEVPSISNSGLLKVDNLISNLGTGNIDIESVGGGGQSGTISALALALNANDPNTKNITVLQNTLTTGSATPMLVQANSQYGSIQIAAGTGSLTLQNMSAGSPGKPGNISVTTGGSLSTSAGIAANHNAITAVGGSLTLAAQSGGTSISFGAYTDLTATGTETFQVGSPLTSVPGTANPNVNTSQANGVTLWGTNGVIANAGSNSAIVSNQGTTLTFSEQPSQTITLQGNDTFTLN